MSEEQEAVGMSGVKKAIIGAITTAVTAGGAWFATHLGGGEEKAEAPTAVTAPAPVINITNSNENQQKQQNNGGGNTVIIKEKTVPASAPNPTPAAAPASKPPADEEDPW
jgi:hypothetical protein